MLSWGNESSRTCDADPVQHFSKFLELLVLRIQKHGKIHCRIQFHHWNYVACFSFIWTHFLCVSLTQISNVVDSGVTALFSQANNL